MGGQILCWTNERTYARTIISSLQPSHAFIVDFFLQHQIKGLQFSCFVGDILALGWNIMLALSSTWLGICKKILNTLTTGNHFAFIRVSEKSVWLVMISGPCNSTGTKLVSDILTYLDIINIEFLCYDNNMELTNLV